MGHRHNNEYNTNTIANGRKRQMFTCTVNKGKQLWESVSYENIIYLRRNIIRAIKFRRLFFFIVFFKGVKRVLIRNVNDSKIPSNVDTKKKYTIHAFKCI